MSSSRANSPGLVQHDDADVPRRGGGSWPASRRPRHRRRAAQSDGQGHDIAVLAWYPNPPSRRDPQVILDRSGRDALRHCAARRPPLRRRRAGRRLRTPSPSSTPSSPPRRSARSSRPAASGRGRRASASRGASCREAPRAAHGRDATFARWCSSSSRPRAFPAEEAAFDFALLRSAGAPSACWWPPPSAAPSSGPSPCSRRSGCDRPRSRSPPTTWWSSSSAGRAPSGRVDPPRRRRRRRAHARRQRPRREPEHRRPGRERTRRRGARQPPDAPLGRVRCGLDLRRRREQPPRVARLGALGLPVGSPPLSAVARRALGGLEDSATAPRSSRPRWPPARASRLDLLPAALRPRRLTREQRTTVVLAAITALLGLGALGAESARNRHELNRVESEIRRIDPRCAPCSASWTTSSTSADCSRLRRRSRGIAPAPASAARTHGDAATDVWLTTLTLDAKGVELTARPRRRAP